jgi:ElaB/YqjD/DUF883 family membrane-anchored ribosome-binding protein
MHMPLNRTTRDQLSAEHRRLHARISRLRRRLDRRVDRLVDRTLVFGAWREYVQDNPSRALLAAAGVGFVLSGLASSDRGISRFGDRLYELATGAAWGEIWQQLRSLAEREPAPSASGAAPPAEEPDNA